MLAFSPMNPEDEDVPFLLDFTSILAPDETITSVTTVAADPDTITVGTSFVADGTRPKCAVQFTLGGGALDTGYMITVEIVTSNNVTLARSCYVPVRSV